MDEDCSEYEGDNEYEAIRHARIKANRKVLSELGVQNAAADLQASKQSTICASKCNREQAPASPGRTSPPRRSARQRGVAAEVPAELPDELKPQR